MSLGPGNTALQPTGEEDDPAILGRKGSADFDYFDHDSYMLYEDDQEVKPQPMKADLVNASGKPINQQSISNIPLNAKLYLLLLESGMQVQP